MLNPDFSDMLSCLRDEKVEFIVVGAYALAAHGFPRATGDIDIWVRNTPENARSIVRALAKFGAPLSDISEDDFTSPDHDLHIDQKHIRLLAFDHFDHGDAILCFPDHLNVSHPSQKPGQ